MATVEEHNAGVDKWLREIKRRIGIDEFSLNTECREQPALYSEVGEACVEAKAEAKKAKSYLDLVAAKTDSDIRSHPNVYGLVKVTEGSIQSSLLQDKKYIEAKNTLLDAERWADIMQVLQNAVDQRRSMLHDMVTLYVYSYYSEVKSKPINAEQAREVTDERIAELRKNRNNAP